MRSEAASWGVLSLRAAGRHVADHSNAGSLTFLILFGCRSKHFVGTRSSFGDKQMEKTDVVSTPKIFIHADLSVA